MPNLPHQFQPCGTIRFRAEGPEFKAFTAEGRTYYWSPIAYRLIPVVAR